jgi:hypothetical protein
MNHRSLPLSIREPSATSRDRAVSEPAHTRDVRVITRRVATGLAACGLSLLLTATTCSDTQPQPGRGTVEPARGGDGPVPEVDPIPQPGREPAEPEPPREPAPEPEPQPIPEPEPIPEPTLTPIPEPEPEPDPDLGGK